MTTFGRHAHLGPYEILSPLGAGGIGEVYRTLDSQRLRQAAAPLLLEPAAVGGVRPPGSMEGQP